MINIIIFIIILNIYIKNSIIHVIKIMIFIIINKFEKQLLILKKYFIIIIFCSIFYENKIKSIFFHPS